MKTRKKIATCFAACLFTVSSVSLHAMAYENVSVKLNKAKESKPEKAAKAVSITAGVATVAGASACIVAAPVCVVVGLGAIVSSIMPDFRKKKEYRTFMGLTRTSESLDNVISWWKPGKNLIAMRPEKTPVPIQGDSKEFFEGVLKFKGAVLNETGTNWKHIGELITAYQNYLTQNYGDMTVEEKFAWVFDNDVRFTNAVQTNRKYHKRKGIDTNLTIAEFVKSPKNVATLIQRQAYFCLNKFNVKKGKCKLKDHSVDNFVE